MATFSYADAAKYLGGTDSKVVTAIDRLLGGALLTGSGLDLWGLLGWFDAKAEFIRLSHDLVHSVSGRAVSRYTRTQRLHAAHTIIVVTAFFESFDELETPLTTKGLGITKKEQLLHLSRETVPGCQPHELAVPLPSPEAPHEVHLQRLRSWYKGIGVELVQFLQGLAMWANLESRFRGRLIGMVDNELPDQAVVRYQELFRQLAGEFPEVTFWWTAQDAQATRAEIRLIGTALARLEQNLATVTSGRPADQRRADLARRYQAMLRRPVIEQDQGGITTPSLGECYVDPIFQVCAAAPGTDFASTEWWGNLPERHDLHRFLTGLFTAPGAVVRPLLVLGDPGSGKSVLTKMVAARLPVADFLAIRVELRSAPAEGGILDQIEHGLRDALQEQVSWPALAKSAGQALPVVLLDGFDELLQATGVGQTDYLHKIARFQRDSLDLGHPVAVVVTSRISVADRAAAPTGTIVLRLMPFDSGRVRQWINAWNKVNAEHFEAAGLSPLSFKDALRYPELSGQPLLLLMLALYDADDNALRRHTGSLITHADLYERLLTQFASREVRKDGDHRGGPELTEAVETELERLSIVAFAMFNRGTQWVTERDLDSDLASLLPATPAAGGLRTPLSAGEIVLGRFFFVQQAQATRDQRTLRTYEFLHATFGEYLVARATWRIVLDLVAVEEQRPRRRFAGEIDDSALHALLSFTPLCAPHLVVEFLVEMAAQVDENRRRQTTDLLLRLFRTVGGHRQNMALGGYEPVPVPVPARYAAYSQNLVVLAVVANLEIRVSELFGPEADAVEKWRNQALLWQSQLSSASWRSLVDTMEISREWRAGSPDVVIRIEAGYFGIPGLDLEWHDGTKDENHKGFDIGGVVEDIRRDNHFRCSWDGDLANHVLTLLDDTIPTPGWSFRKTDSGDWHTCASVLLRLLVPGPVTSAYLREYLAAWASLPMLSGETVFTRLMFDALASRPSVRDLAMVEEFPKLASDTRFWTLLCDRIGRHDDDSELLLLCRCWDTGKAFRGIPESVVDAWLRMTERGMLIPAPAPSLLTVLDGIDLVQVGRKRPDLIKRARAAMADIGQLDTITWPR
jgi:NACHT N-terminal Helical domain 7